MLTTPQPPTAPSTRSDRPFIGWVDELARRHTRELVRTAAREGLSTTDALDAVQEAYVTFLGLPQARTLVEHPEEVGAFLATIVRHAARNARRRHHRARPHLPVETQALVDDAPSIDVLLERAEAHVALLGCVRRLAETQRHVVSMRVLQELSVDETATQLALTPGHVAVLLHRAKRALGECMEG